MKKLEVINVYKHNIVYRNIKNRQQKLFFNSAIPCFLIVFIVIYMCGVNADVKNFISVFNPISELYRDVEVASFVGQGNVNFIAPIKTSNYEINLNNIAFQIDSSIMVYCPANGVVESISKDNERVIKIKHSNNLYSIIKNVNIVGVNEGQIVSQGKEIATAKTGDIVIFMIELDGKYVEGLYLNKNFVKWRVE